MAKTRDKLYIESKIGEQDIERAVQKSSIRGSPSVRITRSVSPKPGSIAHTKNMYHASLVIEQQQLNRSVSVMQNQTKCERSRQEIINISGNCTYNEIIVV